MTTSVYFDDINTTVVTTSNNPYDAIRDAVASKVDELREPNKELRDFSDEFGLTVTLNGSMDRYVVYCDSEMEIEEIVFCNP